MSDSVSVPLFRFWQLVRQSDGTYVALPYITLFANMIVIEQYSIPRDNFPS